MRTLFAAQERGSPNVGACVYAVLRVALGPNKLQRCLFVCLFFLPLFVFVCSFVCLCLFVCLFVSLFFLCQFVCLFRSWGRERFWSQMYNHPDQV